MARVCYVRPDHRLSRRQMVRMLAASSAGGALIGCAAPSAPPTRAPSAAATVAAPPPTAVPAPPSPVATKPAPAPTAAPTAVPTKPSLGQVRFHFPSQVGTMIPVFIVSKRGFDKEEGFTAQQVQAAGATGVRGLVAGEFGFSQSASSAMAAAIQGAPVRLVIVHIDKSLWWLFAKPEIKSVADLRGKSIGIGDVGGSGQVAARLYLQHFGLDEQAVDFVATGAGGAHKALIAGAVDAAVLTPPDDLAVRKAGNFTSLGFVGDLVPAPISGLATTQKLITEQPDLIRAVVRATMKGHRYLAQNRQGSIPLMMEFLNLNEEEANLYWETFVRVMTKDGRIPVQIQQEMIDSQLEVLKPTRVPRPDEVFDFKFLD